jgi:hypothetical protein
MEEAQGGDPVRALPKHGGEVNGTPWAAKGMRQWHGEEGI